MADLSTTYVITAPAATVTFNLGDLGDGTDKFWLKDVQGLDVINASSPVDKVPMGDGSIIHEAFPRGMTPYLEGDIIIESVSPWGSGCQAALNVMEEALRLMYDSMLAPTSGTLAWTPAGLGARSLPVYRVGDRGMEIRPIENFALRQFTIPLMAADSIWS